MKYLLSLFIVAMSMQLFAASCIGTWITIDDETGKQKSKVRLFKYDGKLCGKIEYLYPREGREKDPKCTKCTGSRKNQPLIGLQIVWGLEWDGSEWEGGFITDPENGKVYDCKMWINNDKPDVLNVRGYVGLFYRTQYWKRVKD